MYEQLNNKDDLASYHAKLVETLMREIAFGISKTLENPEAQNVHDLRRLVLRLRHSLRLFKKLLPGKAVRKVQRRLKALQDLLAGVRSCDVAGEELKLGAIAPVLTAPEARKITAAITQERRRNLRPLRARLKKMQRSDSLKRWRTRLFAA